MPGPNWLSQAELDDIRSMQNDLIDEIGGFCDIKRPTYVPNGKGGSTQTFVTQSNVPFRHFLSSGPNGTSEEAKFWGEQERNQQDAFVTFPWDTDIRVEDWIRYDGKDWHVVGLQTNDTLRTAIKVRVETMRV